jgi:hypothetical protein
VKFRPFSLRLLKALGLSGATVLGLYVAWLICPKLIANADSSAALHEQASKFTYRNNVLVGQFKAYVIVLLCSIAAPLVYAVLGRLTRKRGALNTGLAALFAVFPLALTATISRELFALSTVLVLGMGALAFTHVGRGNSSLAATSPRALSRFVLLAEATTLGYGAFLVLTPLSAGIMAALPLLAAAYGAGRLDERRAHVFALAGAPLLALPLLAFERNPSAGYIALALAFAFVLFVWQKRSSRTTGETPQWLFAWATPCALAMIPMVPLCLRELSSVNYEEHEAFHLAWINSALHGKILGADAGLVHGPLRDYAITAFLLVTKVDLAHVRIAFVLVNVAGFALLLPIAWEFSKKNLGVFLLGVYLLLMQTPARAILWYRHMISLGWADLARTALPSLGMFLVLSQLRAKDSKKLLGGGILLGLSMLYSQEFALCAILGTFAAVILDAVLSKGELFAERIRNLARLLARMTLAVLAPIAVLLALYAARGKAGSLLRAGYESIAFPASGAWGALPFPLDHATIVQPHVLFKEFLHPDRHYDSLVVFLLPVLIYVITSALLVWRFCFQQWSLRTTLYLGFWVFGVLSYRVTVATPDVWHLLSATNPAILLLVGLIADAAAVRLHLSRVQRLRSLPVGGFAVGIAALLILAFGEYPTGVVRRLTDLSTGFEKPSVGQPYVSFPRAGDVLVPANVTKIVSAIQARTQATDPIFVCVGMFNGAELYFFANRRNPTRFDTLSEVLTVARQKELLEQLTQDPPALIIGTGEPFVGPVVTKFFQENYGPAELVGDLPMRLRRK